ncbi:MAG TPA: HAD hydrolase-like protein [Acidimicrobiia bacterium]
MIFDLDGTLADTHEMAIGLIGETIERFGGPWLGPDELIALFGPNEKGIFRGAVGVRWEEAWAHYLGEYPARHRECPAPFPGIFDLVVSLQSLGANLGVITGKTARTGRISLDVLGLSPYFSDLRGGAMEGIVKRTDIAAMVSSWGLGHDAVAYVGDTATDVVEAKAAGVVAIAACWSDYADEVSLRAAEPDLIFVTVEELANWLETNVGGS